MTEQLADIVCEFLYKTIVGHERGMYRGFRGQGKELSELRDKTTFLYFGEPTVIYFNNAYKSLILRDDAPNGDLGYPASIELEPGVILTVYYQPDVPPGSVQRMKPPDPGRTKPGILGTIWKVPPRK